MIEGIAGVVLAGGQGSRMGGEPKVLRRLGGLRLLDRALERAEPQVGVLLLSCGLDPEPPPATRCVTVRDPLPGHAGPLAGLVAAMDWLRRHHPGCERICTFAADTPWFPLDLVERLESERSRSGAAVALAASGGRDHPVFALWPLALADELGRALRDGDPRRRGLARCMAGLACARVEWGSDPDPFFNVNTPEDLDEAGRRLARPGFAGR